MKLFIILPTATIQQLLTMSISCDFIFSCTKGKTTAAISFEVLYASILASERKGEGFKEMLQKLKD